MWTSEPVSRTNRESDAPTVTRTIGAWSCSPLWASKRIAASSSGRITRRRLALLDLDLGTLLFQRSLDLVGLLAVDALLHGLRGRVDEVLGLLEAEAGELADDLDHGDLVRADLGEDGGELGLLLGRGGCAVGRGGGATAGGCGGNRDRGRSGHAELVLELLLELRQLENGHLLEGLEQLVGGHRCHGSDVSLDGSNAWVGRGQAAAACLSASAEMRPATSRNGASNSPAVVASGAVKTPAICDSSVSRDGSDARRMTPSASIARSPSSAPVIRTWRYGRIVSMTALVVAPSSWPKAIAVGPVRSESIAEPTVS